MFSKSKYMIVIYPDCQRQGIINTYTIYFPKNALSISPNNDIPVQIYPFKIKIFIKDFFAFL